VNQVKRNALEVLESVAPESESHTTLLFSAQIYPWFEVWKSCQVWTSTKGDEAFARFSVWDKPFDSSRFHDPMQLVRYGISTEPRITERFGPFNDSEAKEVTRMVMSLTPDSLQLTSKRGIILDGTQYQFRVPHICDKRLEWNLPSQLGADLSSVFQKTEQLLAEKI